MIVYSSVTQHVNVVGSPFILWFLYVSFLKIVHPSMRPAKIASLERGAALMKLCQAQLKSPQQLLKSPQQLLKNHRVIANFISLKKNLLIVSLIKNSIMFFYRMFVLLKRKKTFFLLFLILIFKKRIFYFLSLKKNLFYLMSFLEMCLLIV